jgi:hypothetical protein
MSGTESARKLKGFWPTLYKPCPALIGALSGLFCGAGWCGSNQSKRGSKRHDCGASNSRYENAPMSLLKAAIMTEFPCPITLVDVQFKHVDIVGSLEPRHAIPP